MESVEFEGRLQQLRPWLHRYCSRMTGSTIDGEDVVQETLVKALEGLRRGTDVARLEPWLLRIAYNASIDFHRRHSRANSASMLAEPEPSGTDQPDIGSLAFIKFMQLPEFQRCAVILKDVLGHSVAEIALTAGCTGAAAKSALQRGRAALRKLSQLPEDELGPPVSEADRLQLDAYVQLFRDGDFDRIREMLAQGVQLELVNRTRLSGAREVAPYFSRYAEETRWRYAAGAVEGRPAMLVFDQSADMSCPSHFALVGWRATRIVAIRDFLFAGYVMEQIAWTRLG